MTYFGQKLHLAVSQPPESLLLLLGQAQQLFGEQLASLPAPISGILKGGHNSRICDSSNFGKHKFRNLSYS